MSENPYCEGLPADRLEGRFERKRPLLDDVQARVEAARCLFCHDAPCSKACPASIDVSGFIWDIHSDNWRGAARHILKQNVFGLSCAMVCPVPDQCEGACVLRYAGQPPVSIAQLQRYAVDRLYAANRPLFEKSAATGKKVALVGAGPASIACAHELTLKGHACTVYEKRHMPGGLGTYAMAPYKVSAEEVLDEVLWIQRIGFDIECGVAVGRDVPFEKLLADYDALFIGIGLGDDTDLALASREPPPGVIGALELIQKIKTAPAGDLAFLSGVEDAVIIGGGSTAMDVAQELRHLGVPGVTIVYRRAEEQMPSHAHERDAVRKAGAVIRHLRQPVDYLYKADGAVAGLKLARCELGEPGADGRRSVRVAEGKEELIAADLVIQAIGQEKPRKVLGEVAGISFAADGCVLVRDEQGRTGNPKVFAGGDCVNGGWELVHAVAAGRNAARAIDELLTKGA